ncbi:unnamed protein product [Brugia pahangi]|uniref:Uncharacterized protein n=1 Tax=Brugia pahangi TaxID=6280 RepID=A0A0N4TR46_BRUPA|nr:unnamed protein product [Brugia pahangi]
MQLECFAVNNIESGSLERKYRPGFIASLHKFQLIFTVDLFEDSEIVDLILMRGLLYMLVYLEAEKVNFGEFG